MPGMSVERATRDHEQFLTIAGKLRGIVGGACAVGAAYATLREFESRLHDHRHEEEQSVYRPLLAYAEERSAEFRSVLDGMLTTAGTDWSSYMAQWTRDRIGADWAGFGADTRRILDGGRARLCLESEILYPLALREGLVPMRSATIRQ